ncbi:MAG: HEAT repeat domain-containing protein [Phycisphaerales bacterium]|nr:HEAT repeat domain-containing protein [Planctomycetota bacterium]
MATSQEAGTRLAVAELAGGGCDSTLAAVAVELLSDRDELVAAASEQALLRLALLGADPESASLADHPTLGDHEWAGKARVAWTEADHDRVRSQVASAVRLLTEHRRDRVLLAALMLLDPGRSGPGTPLGSWLRDREQSSHSFLRGFLRRDDSPLSRLRAWQWLGTTAVSGAAIDRLLNARALDEHEAVLAQWHLAANPARLWRLKRNEAPGRRLAQSELFPPVEIAERLSEEARRGVAGVAELSRLPADRRDALCESLLADQSRRVRHGATRACSSRLLADFCFDPDPDVARSATIRCSLAAVADAHAAPGSERMELERKRLVPLARSPHAAVRAMALQDQEELCAAKAYTARARIAFRRAAAADQGWVLERLRELLAGNEEDRSLSLALARGLGLLSRLKEPLVSSVRHLLERRADPDVPARGLATAVTALAEIQGEEVRDLLDHAAESNDPRVRANAIDSMVRRVRNGAETDSEPTQRLLIEFKEDQWHRIRGSAVRGLAVLGEKGATDAAAMAGEQVLRMLEDARPMHRLAGAWVADRTLPGRDHRELKLWPALVARLRSLAVTDLESRVRARAKLALARVGEEPVGVSQ